MQRTGVASAVSSSRGGKAAAAAWLEHVCEPAAGHIIPEAWENSRCGAAGRGAVSVCRWWLHHSC